MAPRETENNAYAKFWGDKQRTLWYVMVFLEWSIALGVWENLRYYGEFFMGIMIHCYHSHGPISETWATSNYSFLSIILHNVVCTVE